MAQQIQLRRGSAAQWTATNPILAAGEIGVELDTGKMKTGDGATAWTGRPYIDAGAVAHIANAVGAHAASAIAFSPTGTIAATTVQGAIAELDAEASSRYLSVFTPEAYSSTPWAIDVDFTDAIQAAWTAAEEAGGKVRFGSRNYLVLGELTIPHDPATPYASRPTIWEGSGADAFSPETSTRDPQGGTILDFRGGGSGPACVMALGDGRWESFGVTFWQSGATAHTKPYILTTNTRLDFHHNSFFGHPTKLTTLCNQDAIVLGGTTQTIGISTDAPFQGYGTVIQNNHFQRIRRAVHGRTYANGNVVRDNNIWHLCGSPTADQIAAIEFEGVSSSYCTGNVIDSNLIEMPGYVYGIRLRGYCLATGLADNNFYDFGAQVVAPIRIDATNLNTRVVAGYAATTVPHLSDAGVATSFLHNNGNGNEFQVIPSRTKFTDATGTQFTNISAVGAASGTPLLVQPVASRSDASSLIKAQRSAAEASNPGTTVFDLLQRGDLTIGGSLAGTINIVDAAGTAVASFSNGLKTWTAAGSGGNMLINTGTGGSYLTVRAFGFKLLDYGGTLTTTMKVGNGTPEGNFAAPVGSVWFRTDGGAGTSMYVKESGTGNTGWVAK